jgi:hypothetical protein
LLDLLGADYIAQHVQEQWSKYNEELIYRIYMTDAIKAMGENKCLTVRYYDIINPKDEETKTAEEIVDDICNHIFGRKENE